jgi:hypothetical protein
MAKVDKVTAEAEMESVEVARVTVEAAMGLAEGRREWAEAVR